MNLQCIRVKSLGFLVPVLVWACSSSDERQPPELGQVELGGGGGVVSSLQTTSTTKGLGGGAGAGGASTLSSGTGGSPTTGATSSTAGTKTSSGGTRPTTTGTGGTKSSGGATSTVTGGAIASGGTSSTRAAGGSRTTGGSKATGGATVKSSGGTTQVASAGGATGGTTRTSGGTSAAGGTRVTGGMAGIGGNTSEGSDGCSDTLALGVTLSEVAVFQSGKISVMQGGVAVTPSTTYGADIIEGRPTLFRAYVTVDGGFASRQLSARLVLNDGASAYYSKQTISASSTELSTTNAFQIVVPASDVTAGLNYSIKIVECATGSGNAHNPQFPASGQASVATRLTGPIKVTAVPVTANNITPTLDQDFVSSVKAELEAMYPTNDVQVTVSTTPITGCAITPSTAADGTTWSNCLDLVRSRRTADKPATDVYYLGVLTPSTSLRSFCGTACIAGISFQVTTGSSTRASLAVGFLPDGLDTMAHELGHAHGLTHSPGCGASSADANFPYVTGGKSYIGWVGWDSRKPGTLLDPAKVTDIMAYCAPQWVSDYVYSKWEDRVASLNKNPSLMGAAEAGLWRVLNIVGNVAQWGQPIVYPEPPSGEPEVATVFDVSGQVIQETTVYRTEISIDSAEVVTAASFMIPEPEDSWHSVLIADTMVEFER